MSKRDKILAAVVVCLLLAGIAAVAVVFTAFSGVIAIILAVVASL